MFAIHKLKSLIDERKISTVELSKELNIVYSTLARLIHGQTTNPRPETVFALAKFFGVKVSDLYDNEGLTVKTVDGKQYLHFADPSCVLFYFLIKNELLNTKALHKATNIPKANLDRIMVGATQTPNMRTLKQLAKYFNITISQLMAVEPIVIDSSLDNDDAEVAIPVLTNSAAIRDFVTVRRDIAKFSTLQLKLSNAQAKQVFVYPASSLPGVSKFKPTTKLVIDTKAHPKSGDFIMARVDDVVTAYELHRLTDEFAIIQVTGANEIIKINIKDQSIIGVIIREINA